MKKNIKSETKVKNIFDKVWDEEDYTKKFDSPFYRFYAKYFSKFNSTSYLYNIGKDELRKPYRKQVVLETGSGKGNSAVLLSKLGITQYLLDISPKAIETIRSNFILNNGNLKKTKFLIASLFKIPIKKDSIDFLWNEGVLEHFTQDEQVQALEEFKRVVKPGGKIVIIIPNKRAKIYYDAKAYAEKNGLWEFGYEKPEETFAHIVKEVDGLVLEKEYSRGFINQLGFMRYYFANNKLLSKLFQVLFLIIQVVLYPLNSLPGYYLISVIRKK